MLLPQRLKQWWAQQLHPILRHHFFHFVLGACTVCFLHLFPHLFKKVLKSTGLADKDQFGFRCRGIRPGVRSEEHTSELQSPDHLVCRLLLEKKIKSESNLRSLP